jgi:hypothetical protein
LEKRENLAKKCCSFIETSQEIELFKKSDVIEEMKVTLLLFESFSDLLIRTKEGKFDDFEEISKEIIITRGEIEKKQLLNNQDDFINRLNFKLKSLQREFDNNQKYNKFINYCVLNELKWIHMHKKILNNRLNHYFKLILLKNTKYVELFSNISN